MTTKIQIGCIYPNTSITNEQTGCTFFAGTTGEIAIPDSPSELLLSGDPGGGGNFSVDDQLIIVVKDGADQQQLYSVTFNCGGDGTVKAVAPQNLVSGLDTSVPHEVTGDITNLYGRTVSVEVTYKDKYGICISASSVWLSVSS